MRVTLIGTATVLLMAAGCASINLRPGIGRNVVPSDATRDQLVALVNRNVEGIDGRQGLKSWRCMQARFDMGPLMKASGNVIVEAPHSFRLRVFPPLGGGDLLDVGSNNDEFWIWQRGMEQEGAPLMLTAHHEDMGVALQHFKIPFQPDWIMEVLGVVAIDGSQYELRRSTTTKQCELEAFSQSVTGERVRKVIRIDPKRGQVVAHELWGSHGELIARAEYSDHRADKLTQVLMPRRIHVSWPKEDLNLGITLDHIEINPPQLPEMAWVMPEKPGCRKIDMGAYARQSAGIPPEIQRVEHEPVRDSRLEAGVLPNTALPPRTASADVDGNSGARPFPTAGGSLAEPFPAAAVESAPLPASGRVRLDSLGP